MNTEKYLNKYFLNKLIRLQKTYKPKLNKQIQLICKSEFLERNLSQSLQFTTSNVKSLMFKYDTLKNSTIYKRNDSLKK